MFPRTIIWNSPCFYRYRENPECCFRLYSGKTPLLGRRFFIPARVPARGGFLISAKPADTKRALLYLWIRLFFCRAGRDAAVSGRATDTLLLSENLREKA